MIKESKEKGTMTFSLALLIAWFIMAPSVLKTFYHINSWLHKLQSWETQTSASKIKTTMKLVRSIANTVMRRARLTLTPGGKGLN